MMDKSLQDATEVARQLAAAIEAEGCDYAFGGAIALGYWAQPRGTVDVDVTLYVPLDEVSTCIRLLQRIGCELDAKKALASLQEHGFCQARFASRRVDVFLPLIPFYEIARQRRQRVMLGSQPMMIWDAATLCVFKMMFFRRKDLADVEQILRLQREQVDGNWVEEQLKEMYGQRDPRISQWQELRREANL